ILTFNIPRDTKTEISGKNSYDKINHAYSYGGTKTTKETVEDFIDSEIDDVVQINMQGFRDLVDAIGVLLSIIHSALNRLMNSVKKHIIMIKVKSISMEKKHFITAECANRTQKVISEGTSVKSK